MLEFNIRAAEPNRIAEPCKHAAGVSLLDGNPLNPLKGKTVQWQKLEAKQMHPTLYNMLREKTFCSFILHFWLWHFVLGDLKGLGR